MRKKYLARLACRIIIFFLAIFYFVQKPEEIMIIQGFNFNDHFSILHLLWFLWMITMIYNLVPSYGKFALGSQKQFLVHFKEAKSLLDPKRILNHIQKNSLGAIKVACLWLSMLLVLGILYFNDIINTTVLFIISIFFYVCDLICVLFWCPFRALIMKNRCCTTCRIFNWGHFMMFSPLIFIPGVYTWSLVLMSVIILVIWEVQVYMYPERFLELTNDALKCKNCTDQLCGRNYKYKGL